MEQITNFYNRINNSKTKKAILRTLEYFVGENSKFNFAVSTLVRITNACVDKLVKDFKKELKQEDVLYLIKDFDELIYMETFIELCQSALDNEDSVYDIVDIIEGIEKNQETNKNENLEIKSKIKILISKKYNDVNSLIELVKNTENCEFQRYLWEMINIANLKDSQWKDLLEEEWAVVSDEIMLEITNYIWSKNKTLTKYLLNFINEYGESLKDTEILKEIVDVVIENSNDPKSLILTLTILAQYEMDSYLREKESLIVSKLVNMEINYDFFAPLEILEFFASLERFDERLLKHYKIEIEEIESFFPLSPDDQLTMDNVKEEPIFELYIKYKNSKNEANCLKQLIEVSPKQTPLKKG